MRYVHEVPHTFSIYIVAFRIGPGEFHDGLGWLITAVVHQEFHDGIVRGLRDPILN